ncbi:MAG: sulfide-dependent adenosine diphosphate thiazole synthase [Thermoproteus sp.]
MELKIGRAIIKYGAEALYEYSDVDVAVVGASPSGLTAARYLAERGFKVIVYERRYSFGGGIGPGGNMFPKIIVQEEALPVLKDFKIRFSPAGDGLYAVDPAEMIAKLAAGAVDAGAKIILGVHVDDVIFRGDPPRVVGLLWVWTPIQMSGMHVDPLYTQAKAVIDATGHDAEVVSIAARKVPELGIQIRGEKSAWSEVSERLVVEHTGRVAPGLYAAGMAVCAVHGLPRMGPIFGGMLLSGRKVAEIVAKDLEEAYAVRAQR